MTSTTHDDPAAIELEIRRTQENMSSTVDRIGDQLSIKNMFNALLDKADESNIDVRMILDGARRNPVALGLIAAGAIWLVSDKDAKIPSMPSLGSKTPKTPSNSHDNFSGSHGEYISHMSAIERAADEDDAAYQRRRDTARSNFFMLERGHEEEESSFRQRLDSMSDKFRDKRRAWADTSTDLQDAAKQKAQLAATKTSDLYSENPLVSGILAAAIGAAFGSALPVTRQEKDSLGSLGQKARDAVGQQTEQLESIVREKKDELVEKADATLNKEPSSSDMGRSADIQNADSPFMVRT
ncbi:DUF3618 domain-containing protein [Sphingorhabdus sp.]|uniref:DUF3618 domain-containing protein n=1 Tax=Sphingorhabdus sp. TaxID=1902408 RepID=UPI003983C9E8